ncbi:substrate-binding periplasmic protein [Roseateles sp.]|uniref:substrate-binding periplasmic protein n=1 Tax=Roseateles sp. TaxID=1971397 RepID=UPI0039E8DE53
MRRPFLALVLALAPAVGQAGCTRDLSVGISELGFGAYLQDGKWRGLAPDLVAELARRSGCHVKFVSRPRARLLLEFERGQLDLITSAMRAEERDRVGQFLPYAYATMDLIFVGDSPPRSLEALRRRPDLKLGIVRGVRLGRLKDGVDALLAARQAEYSPDYDNLAAKLSAGRLQAAIIPSVIHAKLRRDGLLPAHAVTVDLPENSPEAIGLYLHRANIPQVDQQQLQRHLEAMRREGWVQASYVRYVGEAETRRLFRSEAR